MLVVGAGQAGLAIGRELALRDIPFAIVDGADEVGAAWRARWDSLRLFTPRRFSALPGLALPGDPEGYPGKDEVADHLSSYADRHQLPIHLRTPVVRLSAAGGWVRQDGYRADTSAGPVVARQVVVATGPFQRPRIPRFARDLGGGIHQLHASDYRDPTQLPDGPALVVGGGNSGVQIAAELAVGRPTTLAVGSRHPHLPLRVAGRSVFAYLDAVGALSARGDRPVGRVLQRLSEEEPLVGDTPGRLRRRRGVALTGRIVGAGEGRLRADDGSSHRPRSVIWATGYTPDFSWIDLPVIGTDGAIRQRSGVSDLPGLYTIGMPWQRTRGSALLGWVGRDAAHLAARIETVSTVAET